MKILVAPDSYKECLPAREVAAVISQAAREALPTATVLEMPLSDGGEGTLDVLTEGLGGHLFRADVSGPLGRPVRARYGVAGETAVIEVAEACGLGLLQADERNPLLTHTRGVGELLLAAAKRGCRHFLVGLGGSATCDGGAGMLSVPGLREALSGACIELLCDVRNPFVGPQGAARVFAPQKGASARDVEELERRMLRQAALLLEQTGVDVTSLPGAGAAGGLGGAFMACFHAQAVSGIGRVLDLTGFERALDGASLVITGEGRSDNQTLSGKVPLGVLQRSGGVPVALVSGRIEDSAALQDAGFACLAEATPRDLPLAQALQAETARQNIRQAVHTLLEGLIKAAPSQFECL